MFLFFGELVFIDLNKIYMYIYCQVYQTLEHQMVVAEAAQRLRLPLISKDGEVHDEDIEKLSVVSRGSLDSTVSGANSSNYNTPNSSVSGAISALVASDPVEPGVGGVPNRFLGITPAYLWQTQHQKTPLSVVYYVTAHESQL